MKIDLLENDQIELLKNALRVYEKQQKAIATNIANAHNPDFKRLKTDFSEILKGAQSEGKLRVKDSRHFKSAIEQEEPETEREKKVDLMEEMTLLAENQIRHEVATRFLRQKYDGLKQAITGKVS